MSLPAQHAISTDTVIGNVSKLTESDNKVKAGGVFHVKCHDANGDLKWEVEKHNLVVNVGLQDMNTQYFTGAGYTAAWYIGLYGAAATNNPAASDTMSSHAGWTEIVAYSQATRPACTFGVPTTADPSVATNTAAPATYNINGSVTIGGAFLTSSNTKSGTTGVLFSASDFQAPGDRIVVSGDTLTVTYTFSLDAV
jgi:hypothetical protein